MLGTKVMMMVILMMMIIIIMMKMKMISLKVRMMTFVPFQNLAEILSERDTISHTMQVFSLASHQMDGFLHIVEINV